MNPSYFLWAGTDAIRFLNDEDEPVRDKAAAVEILRRGLDEPRDWTLWERRGAEVRLVAALAGTGSSRTLTRFDSEP